MRMGNHGEGAKCQRGAVGLREGSLPSRGVEARDGLPRGGGRAEWKTKVVLSGICCCTLQFEEMVLRRWAFFWRWGHGEMRFSKPA